MRSGPSWRDDRGSARPARRPARFRRRAMLRVAARDLGGASLEDVVAEISAIADACIAEALALAPGGDALARDRPREARRLRTQLRERRRPAVPARGGGARRAGSRRARGGGRHVVARRAHRRGHRAPRGRGASARRTSRRAEPFVGRDPRVLRAGVGHLGAPGHDQGSAGRGPCRAGAGLPAGDRAVRLPARAGARGDRGRPAHEGPAGGVHPAAGQGVHRGQARPRRASATWSSRCSSCRSCTGGATRSSATPNTLAALRALAIEGYVGDGDAEALADAYRFLRRLEHRLQIVRDLQTHDLPPDRRARTTLARSLGLADADELGRAVRGHDRPRPFDPRAVVLPAVARGVRRTGAHGPARPRHRPRRHRGAAGRPRVHRSRAVLRRAGPPRGPVAPDRQGVGAPVPGDGAVARALARARLGARPAGTRRRSHRPP